MPRNRLVTFVILLLTVFVGLSAGGVWAISHKVAGEAALPLVSPLAEGSADEVSLLLILGDKSDLPGFVLVQTDPAGAGWRVTAIPPETVDMSGRRLLEVYTTRNAAEAVAFVQAVTGVSVEHYGVLTYDGLEELLQRAPTGLAFTLPEHLRYEMAEYTIRLDSGTHLLSPTQVTDVLRYPAWQGGRRVRTSMQAEIVAACMDQFFTPEAIAGDAGYNAFAQVADTDWLRMSYMATRDELQAIAEQHTGDVCAVHTLPGSYTGEGQKVRFLIDRE